MIEYAISSNAEKIIDMLTVFVNSHHLVEGMTIADKDGLPLVSFFHQQAQEEALAAISPVIMKDLSSLSLGEIRYLIAMGKDNFALIKPLDLSTFLAMYSRFDIWKGLAGQQDLMADFEYLSAQILRMAVKDE